MKKIFLQTTLLFAIVSPAIAQTTTVPVQAETAFRVAALPRSYYISNKFFVVSRLSQTKYYEEYRDGVKYSGRLRLTDYQKNNDGSYLAYYSGTISR